MRFASLHPILPDTAEIAEDVLVWPHAIINLPPSRCPSLARVPNTIGITRIGTGTELRPFSIVYCSAVIGSACLIGEHATVREGARIGDRCIIGQYACVSYDAELADEVRVQNGTLIADGWKVGRGTFIGVNVSTMSDRRRDVVDYEFKGSCSTTIGERCLIGSGSVILPGLTIGDNVVIGAGALVTKDVPSGSTVLGEPSRLTGERQRAQIIAAQQMSAAMSDWRDNRA